MRMTLTAVHGERGELTGLPRHRRGRHRARGRAAALLLTLEHQRTAVERLQRARAGQGRLRRRPSATSCVRRSPASSATPSSSGRLVGELTLAQQEIIDRVDRNGRRLLLLVEDLLTLSQIESSALKIEPVVTDLRNVVHQRPRGARLRPSRTARWTSTVLVPTQPVVHHGDPVQLERMVVNLLTNAVKFTPDGGGSELQLRTEREHRDRHQDTGMGIPEDEQAQAVHPVLPLRDRDRAGHPGHRARPDHRPGDRRPARRPDRRCDVGARTCGTTVTVSLPRQARTTRAAEHSATGADRLDWPCYWARP